MLKDVGDENIFAQVVRKVHCLVNFDFKEDLLAEQLGGVVNEKLVSRLAISPHVTGPVAAFQVAALSAWNVCSRGEDPWFFVSLKRVSQVLKLQVALTDKNRLRRIPETILLLVGEIWHVSTSLNIFVKQVAHHIDAVNEFIWVPNVEVAVFTIVDLNLKDSLFSLEISKVGHGTSELRVETDIASKLSRNHIRLTHKWQDLFQPLLEFRVLRLTKLNKFFFFSNTILAFSFALSCLYFFLFELELHLNTKLNLTLLCFSFRLFVVVFSSNFRL